MQGSNQNPWHGILTEKGMRQAACPRVSPLGGGGKPRGGSILKCEYATSKTHNMREMCSRLARTTRSLLHTL